MKEKLQKLENGYLLLDLSILGGLLWYWKTKDISNLVVAVVVAAIILWIVALHHGTKVINRTNENVFVKGEDGDEVFTVPSGGLKNNVDGVKVNGKVYKLPDGVRATVTKKGNIFVPSIAGSIIYLLGGGELKSAPDPSWEKLFNV